jgi:predicted PurR-regulated permease PerM
MGQALDAVGGKIEMSRANQMWFWVVGLTLLLSLLYVLSSMLMPFAAGLAVAYFLDPLADKLEARLKSRTAATLVILLMFFAVVAGVAMTLLPLLQDQVTGLVKRLPEVVTALHGLIDPLVAKLQAQLGAAEIQRLKDSAGSFAGDMAGWAMGVVRNLFAGGRAVVNALSMLFIMPVVAFFLLRDWDKMVAKIDDLLPRDNLATIREQMAKVDETIAGFVRGQAMVCLSLGVIYATGLTLVGLDFGLLVGLATGLMAFVPYVGMMIGSVVAFILALIQFSDVWSFVLVGAVFAGGQAFDAVFMTPNFVGGRVGLHPVWVIFALMAGGSLFGFTGVLLAVPTAAVIGVWARFAISRYRDSTLYTGS